jgi:5-methylcytosine-specific restriction endonuclease McrA
MTLCYATAVKSLRYCRKCKEAKSVEEFYKAKTPSEQDHVYPLSRGGSHGIGNVLPVCRPCNLSKGAKFLIEWKGRPKC